MGLAYYRFFPGDYARDTRFLSLMQHGAYRLLIDEYMTNGPLPHNLERLHRVCGATSTEEKGAVEFVLTEFFLLADGRWTHKRCDVEREHQDERSAKARESAAVSVEIRRKRAQETSKRLANVERTLSERLANQNQNQIKKKHSSADADMPAGFRDFWTTWPASPRKVSKAECLKRWRARNLEAGAAAIVTHVALMKATKQWLDGFEPAPLTYLNQRRWEDDVPPLQASGDNQFAGAL